jgi:hypothetical protein
MRGPSEAGAADWSRTPRRRPALPSLHRARAAAIALHENELERDDSVIANAISVPTAIVAGAQRKLAAEGPDSANGVGGSS